MLPNFCNRLCTLGSALDVLLPHHRSSHLLLNVASHLTAAPTYFSPESSLGVEQLGVCLGRLGNSLLSGSSHQNRSGYRDRAHAGRSMALLLPI